MPIKNGRIETMVKDFFLGKLNGENSWKEVIRFLFAIVVGGIIALIGILSLILFGGGIRKNGNKN